MKRNDIQKILEYIIKYGLYNLEDTNKLYKSIIDFYNSLHPTNTVDSSIGRILEIKPSNYSYYWTVSTDRKKDNSSTRKLLLETHDKRFLGLLTDLEYRLKSQIQIVEDIKRKHESDNSLLVERLEEIMSDSEIQKIYQRVMKLEEESNEKSTDLSEEKSNEINEERIDYLSEKMNNDLREGEHNTKSKDLSEEKINKGKVNEKNEDTINKVNEDTSKKINEKEIKEASEKEIKEINVEKIEQRSKNLRRELNNEEEVIEINDVVNKEINVEKIEQRSKILRRELNNEEEIKEINDVVNKEINKSPEVELKIKAHDRDIEVQSSIEKTISSSGQTCNKTNYIKESNDHKEPSNLTENNEPKALSQSEEKSQPNEKSIIIESTPTKDILNTRGSLNLENTQVNCESNMLEKNPQNVQADLTKNSDQTLSDNSQKDISNNERVILDTSFPYKNKLENGNSATFSLNKKRPKFKERLAVSVPTKKEEDKPESIFTDFSSILKKFRK